MPMATSDIIKGLLAKDNCNGIVIVDTGSKFMFCALSVLDTDFNYCLLINAESLCLIY